MNVEGKECLGSPDYVIEGEHDVAYSFTYPSAITINSDSFMSAYRNGSDVSATVLSGSLSGTGTTTLTLKTINGEVGASNGAEYVYCFGVTCGGVQRVYYFKRIVMRRSLR
jgi:hypothetical protein